MPVKSEVKHRVQGRGQARLSTLFGRIAWRIQRPGARRL